HSSPQNETNPGRRIGMNNNMTRVLLALVVASVVALIPMQASASSCSIAGTAGNWGYTYTGTIFTQNGPVPAAAVGHYHQDAAGNISGRQTRSVAGNSGVEDIAGRLSVNKNCTGIATLD